MGTHEIHENQTLSSSKDSTVTTMYLRMQSHYEIFPYDFKFIWFIILISFQI